MSLVVWPGRGDFFVVAIVVAVAVAARDVACAYAVAVYH